MISAINVMVSFVAGAFPARYINHRSWFLKILGFTSVCIILIGLFAGHLFAAHFRDATAALGESRAFQPAVITYIRTPFVLAELNSYLLFVFGVTLALASLAKGYYIDDRYPGFGAMFRRTRRAEEDYDEEYRNLFGDLQDVRDDVVHAFNDALINIPQQAKQASDAHARRTVIVQNLMAYEDHLEQCGNRLLSEYYQENRAHRTTSPPGRFEKVWRLPRTTISDSELGMIGDGAPDDARQVQAVLEEIKLLQREVLDQYEALLTLADRPELTVRDISK